MTEPDDTLIRLFAEAQARLPADDFLQGVTRRMERERRRRGIKLVTMTAAAGGLAIAATPYVARGSIVVADHLGIWLPAVGGALTSPIGWACSVAIAAWSLRRAYQKG
jgi:hypothetical protein